MVNQLNKVLREVLVHDLPINNDEVEVSFDQPKREWSAKLNRPTLNLFLYDIRENTTLRETQWDITPKENSTVSLQRKPVRLDLHYMITAWSPTNSVDDMHNLLIRTLKVLFRYPVLPPPADRLTTEDKPFWQELADQWPEVLSQQPVPIPIQAAQADILRNPAEVWSALDNELRPTIPCTITIALQPYLADTVPLVQGRELRFGQAEGLPQKQQFKATGTEQAKVEAENIERIWLVGGTIRSSTPLEQVRLMLVDYGQRIPVRNDGRFVVGNLQAGEYTLELSAEAHEPRQHKITVPPQKGGSYDIEI